MGIPRRKQNIIIIYLYFLLKRSSLNLEEFIKLINFCSDFKFARVLSVTLYLLNVTYAINCHCLFQTLCTCMLHIRIRMYALYIDLLYVHVRI